MRKRVFRDPIRLVLGGFLKTRVCDAIPRPWKSRTMMVGSSNEFSAGGWHRTRKAAHKADLMFLLREGLVFTSGCVFCVEGVTCVELR